MITTAVVVHWRGRPDTDRCLRSLAAPGGPDRIVVVDNGSGEPFPAGVEVLRLPRNRGFAGGADEGARRALAGGADLLLFLNNDAVLEPGALAEMAAALESDPLAAAAGPLIVRDDGTDRPWFAGGRVSAAFGQVTHDRGSGGERRRTGFLTFCAVLVRRETWESVGPLDEEFFAYGEDADWCLRARRSGLSLLHCPGARVRHRVNGSLGAGSPPQSYLLARARVLLARRHSRGILFWPWLLLVRGPHDFLKSLLTRGWSAAWAGVRGILDGARGGAPRAFRAELGLDGPGAGP